MSSEENIYLIFRRKIGYLDKEWASAFAKQCVYERVCFTLLCDECKGNTLVFNALFDIPPPITVVLEAVEKVICLWCKKEVMREYIVEVFRRKQPHNQSQFLDYISQCKPEVLLSLFVEQPVECLGFDDSNFDEFLKHIVKKCEERSKLRGDDK